MGNGGCTDGTEASHFGGPRDSVAQAAGAHHGVHAQFMTSRMYGTNSRLREPIELGGHTWGLLSRES